MACLPSERSGHNRDEPYLVQELGFSIGEIEALLDGVLRREGWPHTKERALPHGLTYRVTGGTGAEALFRFEPLSDRTFAAGHMRVPRTRFTSTFRQASPECIERWQRRLQQTFLKGGG